MKTSSIATQAGVGVSAGAAAALAAGGDASSTVSAELVTEQLLLIATAVGTIAALPPLIEFLIDRKKRREQIALSLDDERVASIKVRLAGLDGLLAEIADLTDRACHPDSYGQLSLGNELLIVGPTLSGKKMLARRIAIDARMDRLITVYNPRNGDALAKAKSIMGRGLGRRRNEKIVLLLPSIDQVFERGSDELLAELDALIETTAGRHNVLVIGTARSVIPDSPLDSTFGTKILMPGVVRGAAVPRGATPEGLAMLAEVARFYIRQATSQGFSLEGLSEERFGELLLEVAGNPAEIEDIVVLCQTSAIHARRQRTAGGLAITPMIVTRAISRVIVNVPAEGADVA